jgi:hypothetical protein
MSGVNFGDIFGLGGIPSPWRQCAQQRRRDAHSGFTGGGAGNMLPEFAPAAVSY